MRGCDSNTPATSGHHAGNSGAYRRRHTGCSADHASTDCCTNAPTNRRNDSQPHAGASTHCAFDTGSNSYCYGHSAASGYLGANPQPVPSDRHR